MGVPSLSPALLLLSPFSRSKTIRAQKRRIEFNSLGCRDAKFGCTPTSKFKSTYLKHLETMVCLHWKLAGLNTFDPWPALFVVSCASASDHDNSHNGNVQHFNVLQNFGDFDKSGSISRHSNRLHNLTYKISSDIVVLWKL